MESNFHPRDAARSALEYRTEEMTTASSSSSEQRSLRNEAKDVLSGGGDGIDGLDGDDSEALAPPFDAVPGDHDAVVGAEPRRRAGQCVARLLAHDPQAVAQVSVTRHPAGDHLRKWHRAKIRKIHFLNNKKRECEILATPDINKLSQLESFPRLVSQNCETILESSLKLFFQMKKLII